MAITSAGIGSGIDINGLVSQLVEAQRKPQMQRLDIKEGRLQSRLSAFGTLKGALASLQDALGGLKDLSSYRAYTATSSNESVLTASAAAGAGAGSYNISVGGLATSHRLATDPATNVNARLASENDVLGTGVLTFRFGTTTYDPATDTYTSFVQNADQAVRTVTITDGSLRGIRDAINEADIGVSASIIYDGSYARLSLSVAETGAANSLEITVQDDDGNDTDASGLSLLAFNSAATHLQQLQAASDTTGVTIDGIPVSSASNVLRDSISGLTLTLTGTGSTTLTVSQDKSGITQAIGDFVEKFNSLVDTINELSSYDPETGAAGILNGDGVLRSIQGQLRRLIGQPVAGVTGAYRVLADIGITVDSKTGRLVKDDAKLAQALGDDPDAVAALFAARGSIADPFISYEDASDQTRVGSYAVNITQLATQGSLTGAAAPNLTITAGSNDSLSLTVDGVDATITLSPGSYASAADLAAELQARINGASALVSAGVGVKVTVDAGGSLVITSNAYGSESAVSFTGGNAMTGLVGTSPVAVTGKDVAGTIGGVAASGDGQYLTGAGDARDLRIKVTGGALGSRGSIAFTRGYAVKLDEMLGGMLDGDGVFSSITESIQGRIERLDEQREVIDRRLQAYEERIRRQFIAMDAMVAQMQATGNFLAQQLAGLPPIGGRRN